MLKTMGGISMANACVKDVVSFLRYSMSRLELVVWLPNICQRGDPPVEVKPLLFFFSFFFVR